MVNHKVVSRSEWIDARRQFLKQEKEFTRLRDRLSAARRELPWVQVDKEYVFDGPSSKQTLTDLFEGRSQLIVYHFMYDPDWDAGCKSCSFWADNFNGIGVHLNQRDVTFIAVSLAPLEKLRAFSRRMGWSFPWFSSFGTDFNYDYEVSFTRQDLAEGSGTYNYSARTGAMTELPGLSVFHKDDAGTIFHTYSCYARGLDMLNGAYHHLDLVPKGRDEAGFSYPMEWVRPHDMYGK